jgi:8-oxo-dGTP pyrophosphatase MutT (NUDIX family)
MYKVFHNDKLIDIRMTDDIPHLSEYRTEIRHAPPEEITAQIGGFLKQDTVRELCITHNNPGLIINALRDHYPLLPAAGGLVQHNDSRLLFIFRKGKWDLPKGKVDQRETHEEAAIREIFEETGIDGLETISLLPDTFHFLERNGLWYLKPTKWYLFRTACDVRPLPATEEEISQACWIEKNHVHRIFCNIFPSLYEVIMGAWDKLR